MRQEAEHIHPRLEEKDKELLHTLFSQFYPKVKGLLPGLPDDVEVRFDNAYIIPGTGTGGFALSGNTIAVAFDSDFHDREAQLQNIKGTYFHECYHLVQKFTGEDADLDMPPVHNAIYEGAATVFERQYVGVQPGWGDWTQLDEVDYWVEQVGNLPAEFDWRKWKFYDPESGKRWIMYRVGTYIVDKALENHLELDIKDLATLTGSDILNLYKGA